MNIYKYEEELDFDGQESSILNIPDSGTYIVAIAGGYTLVDGEDLPLVLQYRWFADRDGYATTFVKEPTFHCIRLHRLLTNPPHRQVVDHINRVRLDNRRSNLRLLSIAGHTKVKPIETDIIYKQQELMCRGSNYKLFKPYKAELNKHLKEHRTQ